MKKYKVIETFTTAVITEIDTGNDVNVYDITGDSKERLIQAHIEQVENWSDTDYCREIADNAGDSKFEIEEIL